MRLAEDLVETARPILREYGEAERVDGWLRGLERDGSGAQRQRRASGGPNGLAAAVDYLIEETAGGHARAQSGNPAEAAASVDA